MQPHFIQFIESTIILVILNLLISSHKVNWKMRAYSIFDFYPFLPSRGFALALN